MPNSTFNLCSGFITYDVFSNTMGQQINETKKIKNYINSFQKGFCHEFKINWAFKIQAFKIVLVYSKVINGIDRGAEL